jgi:hypothetical protein
LCRENKKTKNGEFMAKYDTPSLTYDSGVAYDSVNPPGRKKKIMAQVVLNISRLNLADLLQQAGNITTSMTDNVNFKTPSPTLLDITGRITKLTSANNTYELTLLSAKENMTLRDDAAQDLIDGLTALAGYVQTTSAGDPAIIQSAGMSIRAARTPATQPEAVTGLAVAPSDAAGELHLAWDAMPNAASFEVQTSADPATATSWTSHPSVTKSKTSVSAFTSGAKVYSRVRAVNPAGTGAWSNEVAKIVP